MLDRSNNQQTSANPITYTTVISQSGVSSFRIMSPALKLGLQSKLKRIYTKQTGIQYSYEISEQEFALHNLLYSGPVRMTKSYSEPTEKSINILPTLDYFQKTYSRSMEGMDQKAVVAFATYESHEKVRRLQNELSWVKDGKVSGSACDRIIGKKRKGKFESYEHWAKLMLLWLATRQK